MVSSARQRAVSAWRRVVWGRRYRRFERRLIGPKLLRAFSRSYPRAFFVEIGANDGKQSDQLSEQVRSGAWRGIMVEPQPEPFRRLVHNYGDSARLALENVAISDHEGTITMYAIEPPERAEDWELAGSYDLLGSASKEALLSHEWVRSGAERITSSEVPCMRLGALLEKHGVERLDLMLVDTEGYDYEIVKQLDGGLPLPRLLIYEHCLMTAADRERCAALVERLGYETVEEMFDTWCLDTSVADELTDEWRRLRAQAEAPVYLRERPA